jgi:hypothetical protein
MNKYHTELQKVQDEYQFKGEDWFEQRKQLINEYGPVIPNEKALVYLSEFNSIQKIQTSDECWTEYIQNAGGSVTEYSVQNSFHESIDTDSVILKVSTNCSVSLPTDIEPAHLLFAGTVDSVFTDEPYSLIAKIELPSFAGEEHSLFHFVRSV